MEELEIPFDKTKIEEIVKKLDKIEEDRQKEIKLKEELEQEQDKIINSMVLQL